MKGESSGVVPIYNRETLNTSGSMFHVKHFVEIACDSQANEGDRDLWCKCRRVAIINKK